jgi:hypothetical protein
VTDVSVSQDERVGSGPRMLSRLFAPIADVLRWAEPFDWDDDEP